MTDDRKEYAIAFAIGAIVGAGATVLLAPIRKKRRIQKLVPAARRARRNAQRFRKSLRRRAEF